MEKPTTAINDDSEIPESWEVADVEESLKKLLICPSSDNTTDVPASSAELSRVDSSSSFGSVSGLSEDDINRVDQFLREALQNPRERLSILRMEQDIEKFIRDPTRQQLEFQQLPTSYLRLAAHRVAQHYFLQSMVLLDNSLPDGSGSRIIVHKTSSECQFPHVRLADIPLILPQEKSGAVKLAIKQRPHKYSSGSSSGNSEKANLTKSVEERKEEYNRARARIFNSTSHTGSSSAKPITEPKKADSLKVLQLEIPKVDKRSIHGGSDMSRGRSVVDSFAGSCQPVRSRAEDPVSRYRPSNKVAIFRDRENESKDPDYDRSYDRYAQRFDPGFGYSAGLYAAQPMFVPAMNYSTEFPQLGAAHRPHISSEPPRPLPQHPHGMWVSQSNPALGYGHPETMMAPFGPNHARPSSTIYLQAPQYPLQPPGVSFIHSHEHIHQTYQQTQRPQHDATIGLARPH